MISRRPGGGLIGMWTEGSNLTPSGCVLVAEGDRVRSESVGRPVDVLIAKKLFLISLTSGKFLGGFHRVMDNSANLPLVVRVL